PTGQPFENYCYQYPIQNCTATSPTQGAPTVCQQGYLWFNGYIPANQINSHTSDGRPNGIMGVPGNYKPAFAPLIPYGTTALPANAPANTDITQFWDTNSAWRIHVGHGCGPDQEFPDCGESESAPQRGCL